MKQENNRAYIPGSCGEPEYFTPGPEEQTRLILEGKCPHNRGWRYDGHGHNSESYSCMACGRSKEH